MCAFFETVVCGAHCDSVRGGDGDEPRVLGVGRAFDSVPDGKESVKSLDQPWVSVKQLGYVVDNAGCVNAMRDISHAMPVSGESLRTAGS